MTDAASGARRAPLPQAPDTPCRSRAGAAPDHGAEEERARRLAERYRLEYVDMAQFYVDQEMFRSIPVDLMLRYGLLVPFRRDGDNLAIVVIRSDGPAGD